MSSVAALGLAHSYNGNASVKLKIKSQFQSPRSAAQNAMAFFLCYCALEASPKSRRAVKIDGICSNYHSIPPMLFNLKASTFWQHHITTYRYPDYTAYCWYSLRIRIIYPVFLFTLLPPNPPGLSLSAARICLLISFPNSFAPAKFTSSIAFSV